VYAVISSEVRIHEAAAEMNTHEVEKSTSVGQNLLFAGERIFAGFNRGFLDFASGKLRCARFPLLRSK
jgi:hypothetical protein